MPHPARTPSQAQCSQALRRSRWFVQRALVWACLPAAATAWAQGLTAAGAASGSTPAPIVNSVMDDRLMYQLLVAEMALARGDAATAYDWMLDAARRTRDEVLFRRSTDVALQGRAGDRALAATRAWRLARPESLEALRTQVQILLALQRTDALQEPLQQLLAQSPEAERSMLISALPRFLQRAGDPQTVAKVMEEALKPYRRAPATRAAAAVALGRAWLEAKDGDLAWKLTQEAQAFAQAGSAGAGAALLAIELLTSHAQAESLVQRYLSAAEPSAVVRLAFARHLTSKQRYTEAVTQLHEATRQQPAEPQPYLTLGALLLELKQTREAQVALMRYVSLASQAPAQAEADLARAQSEAEEGEVSRPDQGLVQAWLMLAQVAEQLGDYVQAEAWLARIDDPATALEVQTRRASLLVRQGRLDQALQAIRLLPESGPEQARPKLLAEVSVLREGKRWQDAFELLGVTLQRFGEDADLLYEQSMMAEKLGRLEVMERLLQRVIELKPKTAHAYNALGYSLADRNVRLDEARQLIRKALELTPGDPYITDSLGWVEYRAGNIAEALRLLREAWAKRPDTEIGAHLGEVLWVSGRQDEARRIWAEAKNRDATNDVLRETLARLRASL